MLSWIIFIALTGLIAYGILMVIKVLDYLFTRIATWVQTKIRERQGKVFAGKLSKIIQEASENPEAHGTIDLSSFGNVDPDNAVVLVRTNDDHQIENEREDIVVVDATDLDASKDVRDRQLLSQLNRKPINTIH